MWQVVSGTGNLLRDFDLHSCLLDPLPRALDPSRWSGTSMRFGEHYSTPLETLEAALVMLGRRRESSTPGLDVQCEHRGSGLQCRGR
jgi:hypothetical protein